MRFTGSCAPFLSIRHTVGAPLPAHPPARHHDRHPGVSRDTARARSPTMQVPAPFDYERADQRRSTRSNCSTPRPGVPAHRRRPQPDADDEAAAGPARRRSSTSTTSASCGTSRRRRHAADRRAHPARRPARVRRRRRAFPIFHDAERVIADPVVRNRGTVGGSLCQADPSEDLSAALPRARRRGRHRGPAAAAGRPDRASCTPARTRPSSTTPRS